MYKQTVRNVVVFALVVIFSGWIGVLVDSVLTDQPEWNSIGMGVWLVLPMLAALCLCFTKSGFREVGFRPNIKGNIKWYLAAISLRL